MTWLITDIKLNKLEWFSTVDKGASGDKKHRARIVLWKREKEKPAWIDRLKSIFGSGSGTKPTDLKKQEQPMTLEEILAKLPEEERNVILAALQAAKAPVTEPAQLESQEEKKEEELQKRLKEMSPELSVAFEKSQKEAIELKKQIADMKDAQRTIEFEKRAKELGFLPIATVELAKMLKDVDDSLEEGRSKAFVAMLEKIEKAMRESAVFTEYGAAGSSGVETALEKRDRLVAEMIEKDPKLSVERARTQLYKRDKELFNAVRDEIHAN